MALLEEQAKHHPEDKQTLEGRIESQLLTSGAKAYAKRILLG
jgi:hypothetical protein